MKSYQFHHLVLGGTFDYLHQGHKVLIDKAFSLSQKVTIGLCDDSFLQDKFLSSSIENYSTRFNNLKKYLISKNYYSRAKILKLKDIFGTTLEDKTIEAILVTKNTRHNAIIINQKRQAIRFPPLKIITHPLILAEDGKPISSERIRRGEIDQRGKSYWVALLKLFLAENYKEILNKNLKNQSSILEKLISKHHQSGIFLSNLSLPENLKPELRKPLGQVFLGKENEILKTAQNIIKYINKKKPTLVFTVGDMISYSLIKKNFIPNLKIIDFLCQRKKLSAEIRKELENKFQFKIENQRGKISFEAVLAIKNAVSKILTENNKQTIFITGEEDLLVLPLIIFSPLKTLIFYGHWQLGALGVEVGWEIKKTIFQLLDKFQKL